MNMENILNFISQLFLDNGIIIAVAAFVVAQIIKGFESIPKSVIPLIGGIIGIALGVLIPGLFPGKDIITSGVMGLALGWAATGGYETVKNLKETI